MASTGVSYSYSESNNRAREVSTETKCADLKSGPTVVVPAASYLAPPVRNIPVRKDSMMDDDTSSGDSVASDKDVVANYAFAFDIDGVLIRGGTVIPEAKEAMKVLNGGNSDGTKVPYIFLTNGGGKTEEERCRDLSRQLGVPVLPQQFICGHTPMRQMANKYGTVLVVGGEGEKCRHVAEGYGFRDVVTPGDIMLWRECVTPFRKLTENERQGCRSRDFSKIDIEAIFVFADSRHWGDDAQIILDLLMSKGGRMGTLSDTFEEGPPIFFSHNDVVWSTNYELTRFGMGALRVMIEALYKERTGKELTTATSFGKPQLGTFEYATRVLEQWRKDEFGVYGSLQTVYFVGDTLESDIKGTNAFDNQTEEEWHSILVKTGVYQPGDTLVHQPKKTVDTVLDAVLYGMERSKSAALDEMKDLGVLAKA